jgi:hypothetical protein
MKTPRRYHRQPGDFRHHAGETAMPKAFLEASEDRGIRSGFGIDHAVGAKPDLRDGWREQVAPPNAPQSLPMRARQDAGGEQVGGPMQGAIGPPATSCIAPKRQTAAWRRSSISGTPNGKKPQRTRLPVSIRRICSRRASIWAGAGGMGGFNWCFSGMFPFRSL